ncbi:MAG TPA: tyrosine--tRNA ligase [Chloroflexota bacterium]|nr:tyrosine--tRNA ligase [Chloroflexota bacterium]
MAIATAPTQQATAATRTAYDVLQERGLVYQCSDETGLRRKLAQGGVSFYLGIDPTADSLHIGHLVGVMTMARLQQCGLRPVALVGGGTTMIGDPTDKTAARRIMSRDEIAANAQAIKGQLARFLDFSETAEQPEGRAVMVDNAEWLLALNYIEFLRDYGKYFSVNDMLRMETYRSRLETGLTFIEFNYALLQAYDFLELYRRHGCTLQIGGSDQWSNVLAGADLIKKCEGAEAYALTWPLVSDSSGQKMGKSSATGQVWLDPRRTSPYDYYQYWINVDDSQVERMLMTYTFLPTEEVRALSSIAGEQLRVAKERLAWEATTLAHGEDEARKAQSAARRLFGGATLEELASAEDVPTVEIDRARFAGEGVQIVDLMVEAGLAESKGAARRLIEGGGAYLNKERLALRAVTEADLVDGALMLQAGKKRYVRVVAR